MIQELKEKKIRDWCLFDFGISSYPTLIITFIYGAFYAKEIAQTPEIGTSNWGFAISIGSALSFIIFLTIFFLGKIKSTKIPMTFFKLFFYLLIFAVSSLFFFDNQSNQYFPLIFIGFSLVCFEVINFFYNLSLHIVAKKEKRGMVSNLGWALGYLGGLISLALVFVILSFSKDKNYEIFGESVFLFIGPFVGFWTFIFGIKHITKFRNKFFVIENLKNFFLILKSTNTHIFFISYFFFNNSVICIFSFASMFASFLYGLEEDQILILGISINLAGIMGCIVLGRIEDRIGSEKVIKICIVSLLLTTLGLYFTFEKTVFWLLALLIGFFIGPIQAASRSLVSKRMESESQFSAFCVYSMFGNACSILGPFLVGVVIHLSSSIRTGLLVIPIFFLLSLFFIRRSNA